MRKIVVGSHWCELKDWEIYNQSQVDITKSLPFINESIDFIMSEHTVEHIELIEAISFFRECLRILKPGGIVRTVMPMLDNMLYASIDDPGGRIYFDNNIKHLFEKENKELNSIDLDITDFRKEFQVNGLFYKCKHRFIYSSGLLIEILQQVGFSKVEKFSAGKGNIPENCIEHRRRGVDMSMDYEKNMSVVYNYDVEGYAAEARK